MIEPTMPNPSKDPTELEEVTFYSALPEEWLTPEEIAQLPPNEITHVPPSEIVDLGEGQRMRIHTGLARVVPVTDPATGKRRTVVIPGTAEDLSDEEASTEARQFYADVEHFRDALDSETIAEHLAIYESEKIFQALADTVTKAVRDRISVSVSGEADEPDDLGIPPQQYETAAREATKLLRSRVASIVAELFLEGETAAKFKADYTRDVLALAYAWALEDARAGIEGLRDAGELTPEAATEDALYELADVLCGAGTYITRALYTHFDATIPEMLRLVADVLEQIQTEHPESFRSLVMDAWKQYVETLPPPATLPGFHSGWGTVPNSREARASILAIQGAADGKWLINQANGYPYFRAPDLNLLASPDEYQTPDAAWQAVLSLDDETADTFMIACAQYIANRAHAQGGMVLITPDDVLAQRGIAKHSRAYRPDDREKAAQDILRLGTISVEGYRDGYEGTGRRKKRVRVTLEGKLLEIAVKARQQALADDLSPMPGTGKAVGFLYRLGAWADGFLGTDGSPRLAQMNQTILKYHAKNQRHQKRIGRYLVWIFRIQRGAQSFQVRTLLEQSGITLTPSYRKNPSRFRTDIEAALDDLRRDGVIGSLEWEQTPELPGRKWLDEWLCYTVRITPPAELLEQYRTIGKSRLRPLANKQKSA